jgi:hypothetical protein
VARAKRPGGNGIRLAGIRASLRAAEVAKLAKRDPRLDGDWGPELSNVQRDAANDESPVIRQARRRIEAIDAGAGIITGRPWLKRWPELANVPGVEAVRRVYVDRHDAVRPVFTARQPEGLAAELAAIRAELGLPADAEAIWI